MVDTLVQKDGNDGNAGLGYKKILGAQTNEPSPISRWDK